MHNTFLLIFKAYSLATASDKLQIHFNSWAEQSVIQKQDSEQS